MWYPQDVDTLLISLSIRKDIEYISTENALGRMLGEDILADRPYPPFDRCTMDGVAIHSSSPPLNKIFKVNGFQWPGSNEVPFLTNETACKIFTGAAVPENCTYIVPVEYCSFFESEVGLCVLIHENTPYQNLYVHKKGSDCEKYDIVLPKGTYLDGLSLSIAASVGKSHLAVYKKIRISVLTTGNELVDSNEEVTQYQTRRSNHLICKGFLTDPRIEMSFTHVKDSEEEIVRTFTENISNSEIILSTGGVSMGDADFLPRCWEAIGGKILCHKVAQKPGKPLLIGSFENTLYFGLPGNPGSVAVCIVRYLLPWLKYQWYQYWDSKMIITLEKPLATLHRLIPVRKTKDELVLPMKNSGHFFQLYGMNGVMELPLKSSELLQTEALFYPCSLVV